MFFILSKLLSFVLQPLSWIIGLWILAWFWRSKRKNLIAFSIVVLYIFCNAGLLNICLRAWEYPFVKAADLRSDYQAIVVLGGYAAASDTIENRVHFQGAADRFIQAIHLYKKNISAQILLSGGSGIVSDKSMPEAIVVRPYLLDCAVPDSAILLESNSRNTVENARFSAKRLPPDPNKPILLITSAFHMRRALGCYHKAGYKAEPYPTHPLSTPAAAGFLAWIVPSVEALYNWTILIHEMSGYVVYKTMGYC